MCSKVEKLRSEGRVAGAERGSRPPQRPSDPLLAGPPAPLLKPGSRRGGGLRPRTNHVLVEDLPEVRKAGNLWLPDPSSGHGGTVKSMRPFQLGRVLSISPTTKSYDANGVVVGATVLYSNTAGVLIEREPGVLQLRVIHIDEIQAEIEGDADGLRFL